MLDDQGHKDYLTILYKHHYSHSMHACYHSIHYY